MTEKNATPSSSIARRAGKDRRWDAAGAGPVGIPRLGRVLFRLLDRRRVRAALPESRSTVDDAFFDLGSSDTESFDPSVAFGFRFGGYIDPLPFLGFAGDFSFLQAEGGALEQNDLYPFSFLVLFRAPLARSQYFPYGRFQPYFGIGPSIIAAYAKVETDPDFDDDVHLSSADVGLDVARASASRSCPISSSSRSTDCSSFEQRLDDEHHHHHSDFDGFRIQRPRGHHVRDPFRADGCFAPILTAAAGAVRG
jgi:hypothetical protein